MAIPSAPGARRGGGLAVLACLGCASILYSALGLAAGPPAWEVVSGSGSVYLLGSLHLGRPDLYPLPETVEQAFDAADALVVELDVVALPAQEVARVMSERGRLPESQRLRDVLSEAAWQDLGRWLRAAGSPPERYSGLEPWLVALTVAVSELQRLGYREELGVDRHFLERAGRSKPIIEAESFEAQMSLFDSMPAQEQELFLLETLRELEDARGYFQGLLRAWRAGDESTLDGLLLGAMRATPLGQRIHHRLVVSRNVAMADLVEDLLARGKRYFAVFGVGHLVGEQSLVQILRRRGYEVIRR